MSKQYWNDIYKSFGDKGTVEVTWLDKYEALLEQSRDIPIIDLGCGMGYDSLYLIDNGYKVISCDFSEEALASLEARSDAVTTKYIDIKDGLPFENDSARIIIASLSLHYFPWDVTRKILEDIARVLEDDGVLICRVNSTKDVNYGAGQGILIEKNYYDINGNLKRFFDEEHLCELFDDWEILNMEEKEINRFSHKKVAWEIAVRKA